MSDFYEQLTPYFHMIFGDWDAALSSHADMLEEIITSEWGGSAKSVLVVSCGIGTQSIGLVMRGYRVTASDLSAAAVERAQGSRVTQPADSFHRMRHA
jgi:2-polyprenyl-3-methyl-5-hydroxy-6-metoxy-1,4-benzoquinol methylase